MTTSLGWLRLNLFAGLTCLESNTITSHDWPRTLETTITRKVRAPAWNVTIHCFTHLHVGILPAQTLLALVPLSRLNVGIFLFHRWLARFHADFCAIFVLVQVKFWWLRVCRVESTSDNLRNTNIGLVRFLTVSGLAWLTHGDDVGNNLLLTLGQRESQFMFDNTLCF